MIALHKRDTPVDRSVRELNERMAAVQRQIRALEGQTTASAGGASAQAQPENPFTKRVLSILGQISAPPPQERRALPDEVADPLKDLGAITQDYGPGAQPDLFTAASRSLTTEPAKPVTRESRLARYLKAVSVESSIPLRRVQRENRNQFWIWLGLGLIVIAFICIVVR